MSYKYKYAKNRIIADIEGKQCLIDTGAPVSLGDTTITINGKHHTLETLVYEDAKLEDISKHLGVHLDAMIGEDTLLSHGGLFVWTEKGEIHFNAMMGGKADTVPVEFLGTMPMIKININDKIVSVLVDTGTEQSYVESTFAEGVATQGEFSDFYPGYGPVTSPLVSLPYMEIGGQQKKVFKFAVMPPEYSNTFEQSGCVALLGMDWLRNEGKSHFQINYKDKNFSNY